MGMLPLHSAPRPFPAVFNSSAHSRQSGFRRAVWSLVALIALLAGIACSSNNNAANRPAAGAPAVSTTSPVPHTPATAASSPAAPAATTATAAATCAPAAPAATAAAASVASPAIAASFPITVKRSDGKDLVIKSAPQRIASLSAGATEILYAIGAGKQVVATEKYSNYPPEAQSQPRLDAFRPSPEAIAGAAPDLVLLVDNPGGIVVTLDGLGIPVFWLKVPGSIAETLQQIQLYGDMTGHSAEARRLVASMQARLDAVQARIAGAKQRPRIYHELDAKLFSAAPNSFVGDLYGVLKAQNIAPVGDKQYPQLSQEAIIAADPEVILLADESGGESPDTVKARPGWNVISAVKNGRIFVVDGDIVSRPGPRIVDAVELLAKILYPGQC